MSLRISPSQSRLSVDSGLQVWRVHLGVAKTPIHIPCRDALSRGWGLRGLATLKSGPCLFFPQSHWF